MLQVVNARPNDKDAKLKYNECSKIVRKIAFEKAICVDDGKKSVSETIEASLDNMGKCSFFISFIGVHNVVK